MQEKNTDFGWIPALLLFLFVLGGVLSLLFGDIVMETLPFTREGTWRVLWVLLFLDGVLAASLTAGILLPLLTCSFGFFSACGVKEIFERIGGSTAEWKGSMILLLFLVCSHFCLSSLGMKNAFAMRGCLFARGELPWKRRIIPYVVICFGPAAYLLFRSL